MLPPLAPPPSDERLESGGDVLGVVSASRSLKAAPRAWAVGAMAGEAVPAPPSDRPDSCAVAAASVAGDVADCCCGCCRCGDCCMEKKPGDACAAAGAPPTLPPPAAAAPLPAALPGAAGAAIAAAVTGVASQREPKVGSDGVLLAVFGPGPAAGLPPAGRSSRSKRTPRPSCRCKPDIDLASSSIVTAYTHAHDGRSVLGLCTWSTSESRA